MRTKLISVVGAVLALSVLPPTLALAGDKHEKELRAKIEAMPEKGLLGTWMVGGHQVMVTEKTELEEDDGQKFVIGQLVEVEGNFTGEVLHAKSIETEDGKK